MVEYEIFDTIEEAEAKNATIDAKYELPKNATIAYRDLIKKYDENKWAGMVGDDLKQLCANMPPEERDGYYNDSILVPFQDLIDGLWFAP